jgi:hypothetical protein
MSDTPIWLQVCVPAVTLAGSGYRVQNAGDVAATGVRIDACGIRENP